MKTETKIRNTLILLILATIIISLLNIIFKPKQNLLTVILVFIANLFLIRNWIEDKNIKIIHKFFLVLFIFILSSFILFYFHGFENNSFYIIWFLIMTIGSIVRTMVSRFIKKS